MPLATEPNGLEIPGLRERKKLRTRETIASAAVSLFLRNGFDQVSVSHVAAAADVSKVTVFNYFPTKEDLVLSRIAQDTTRAAQVVRSRAPEESPLQALRRDYLRRLADHDPSTGICADQQVIAIRRMISTTPTLSLRMTHYLLTAESSLAEALAADLGEPEDSVLARIAAGQLLSTERALVRANQERILAGADPDSVYTEAVRQAEMAYTVIAQGLANSDCHWTLDSLSG